MMERNFYNDGFEDLLKQKADQYKVYPSERVWKNIYQSLHSRRRGFTIGGLLLLLLGGFVIMEESLLNEHFNKTQAGFTPVMDASKILDQSNSNSSANFQDNNSAVVIPLKQAARAQKIIRNESQQESSSILVENGEKITAKVIAITGDKESTIEPSSAANDLISQEKQEIGLNPKPTELKVIKPESEKSPVQNLSAVKLSVKRKNTFGFQVYLSPSVTYRRLSEDKSGKSASPNLPVAVDHLDVNKFVNHKPALGAEFGASVFYNVSRNFVIKTGLQMNFMRYSISAYQTAPEKTTIALSSVGRVPTASDTLTTYSNIRNIGGYLPEELQNQYLQVSMPIGAELKLLGDKPFQLNISGSLQPTYLISHSTYLLTDNLTNYIKEPSLSRRWNLYSSIETYISYQSGGVRFQIGPQFRYQLLSSYNSRYPIKEYLMEYGIKFGVTKTLK